MVANLEYSFLKNGSLKANLILKITVSGVSKKMTEVSTLILKIEISKKLTQHQDLLLAIWVGNFQLNLTYS